MNPTPQQRISQAIEEIVCERAGRAVQAMINLVDNHRQDAKDKAVRRALAQVMKVMKRRKPMWENT